MGMGYYFRRWVVHVATLVDGLCGTFTLGIYCPFLEMKALAYAVRKELEKYI